MTTAEQNYIKLKSYFVTELNKVHDVSFADIKLKFSGTINSPRQLYQILSLNDLITVLEKRDVLSYEQVQPFKVIAHQAKGNFTDLLRLINEHEELISIDDLSQNRNQYAEAEPEPVVPVFKKEEPEFLIKTKPSFQPPILNLNPNHFTIPFYQGDKRKLIYDLISRKIGKHWYDLARNLDIAQAEIDEIEIKYDKDFKRRVFAVLNLFEERCDKSKIQYLLCEALNQSRRGDLRKEVDEILSRSC